MDRMHQRAQNIDKLFKYDICNKTFSPKGFLDKFFWRSTKYYIIMEVYHFNVNHVVIKFLQKSEILTKIWLKLITRPNYSSVKFVRKHIFIKGVLQTY